MKKMKIFDWLNEVLVGKRPWDSFSESDQKTFSPFLVNRFLSMDVEFIEIVNYFQKYAVGTLEPREVYKWYCDMLPKGKRFNKYIKGKKDKKYDKEMVDIISKHFQVSNQESKEYIDLLDKNEIKEIYTIYGVKK